MIRYFTVLFLMLYSAILMTSCGSGKAVIKNGSNFKSVKILADTLVKKQHAGVDLFAEGNLPNHWTLEMDFDNSYNFRSNDGILFNTAAYKATFETDSLKTYDIVTSQGEIKILLYSTACETGKKRAEVFYNNTRYSGCASYLYDPKLNGKWILENLNGNAVEEKDFKHGIPEIQFDVVANKMKGTDGCDKINTTISLQGSRIAFREIVLSSKNCLADAYQKIIKEKISNSIVSYYFKANKLYLYLIDDSILIFRMG